MGEEERNGSGKGRGNKKENEERSAKKTWEEKSELGSERGGIFELTWEVGMPLLGYF